MIITRYAVTVFLDVTDPDAVLAAGEAYLVHSAQLSEDEAHAELAGEDGVEKALRLLIDPGTNIPGIEVQDSTCQIE